MTHEFSVKDYLIANKLANEDADLICTDSLPNPAWGLGPYNQWETLIYLCTLVQFFHKKDILDNMLFSLKKSGPNTYSIFIDEVNPQLYPFDWNIVVDTVDYLVPYMAGSNVSYLAGQLFFDS